MINRILDKKTALCFSIMFLMIFPAIIDAINPLYSDSGNYKGDGSDYSSLNSPSDAYNGTNGLSIAPNEHEVAVYKITENEETHYKKLVVSEIIENGSSLIVNISIFKSSSLDSFNPEPDKTVAEILTGNLTNDIIYEPTTVAPILLIGTNFSAQCDQIKEGVENYIDEDSIVVNVYPDESGYNVRVTGSVKIFGRIMDLNLTYSTTGILLYSRYSLINTENFQNILGSAEILNNISDWRGANEILLIKKTDDVGTTNIYGMLAGIIAGIAAIVLISYLYLRKRKKNP